MWKYLIFMCFSFILFFSQVVYLSVCNSIMHLTSLCIYLFVHLLFILKILTYAFFLSFQNQAQFNFITGFFSENMFSPIAWAEIAIVTQWCVMHHNLNLVMLSIWKGRSPKKITNWSPSRLVKCWFCYKVYNC